jgi:hypothetical protein
VETLSALVETVEGEWKVVYYHEWRLEPGHAAESGDEDAEGLDDEIASAEKELSNADIP